MKERKLRFLIDLGVGIKVEKWLKDNDYDLKTVRDLDPCFPDTDILSLAANENRIIMTMDKDFGELVYKSGLPHSGVLLLRLEGASGDEKVRIVRKIIGGFFQKLPGRFSVYQNGKVRIR